MAPTICHFVKSKRTLLALCWSILNLLAFLSFLFAFIVALSSANKIRNNNQQEKYYENGQEGEREDMGSYVSFRAIIFTAIWTMVLSILLGIYGTVILGFVAPTGKYFWCCRNSVYKATPMAIGSFVGSLLMYANLTLVCSVLFWNFKVMDYNMGEGGGKQEEMQEWQDSALSESSSAFSIMCMFLTILYSGFAALAFAYSNDLIAENEEDERQEALRPSDEHISRTSGYIGNKFTIHSPGSNIGQGYINPSGSSDYSHV